MQLENMSSGSDRMNKRLKNGLLSISALVLLLIGTVACGGQAIDVQPSDSDATQSQGSTDTVTPTESKEMKSVSFYYVDEDLLHIQEEQQDIYYSSQDELLLAIWQAFQSPTNDESVSLWDDMKLNDIQLTDQNLVIDISIPHNLQLGSSGEGLAIQTLIDTFGQIEGVETIELLIDGETVESLSGHVSIDEPFAKEDIIYTGE
jgi:spore germination protein GerM